MTREDNTRRVQRQTFVTSRQLDFTSPKELEAQTGHPMDQWALVAAKELADNALDGCEEHGIAPEIQIVVDTNRGSITVADNGPGISVKTVTSILDFSSRTSSREAYVCPTRGAQGNALKTLLAMPCVLHKESGDDGKPTIIEACGTKHSITISEDAVKQCVVIGHETTASKRKSGGGTSVTIPWPLSAELEREKSRFVEFVFGFAMFNPHAALSLTWNGRETLNFPAADAGWSKWLPSNPTPPCWHDKESFERLLAAEASRNGRHTVREFVLEFRGMTRSDKVAQLLEQTKLARTTVAELFRDGKPTRDIPALLKAMQSSTTEVKAADLGVIGKAHFQRQFARLGGDVDSFQYKKVLSTDGDGLPVVIETAFAYRPETTRALFTGVNFSPAINNPFRQLGYSSEGLEGLLSSLFCESNDPVIVAVHLTCPKINYLDRGKGGIALRGLDIVGKLIAAVEAVTKRWSKQKMAEIRSRSAKASRATAMIRRGRETQRAVAFDIMEQAYLKVSDNGDEPPLPANARQLMYACREEIQRRSGGKQLSDNYFTQVLLPDYIKKLRPDWADKVMYDDRGHFREPHTDHEIGLGTFAVRDYLARSGDTELHEGFEVGVKTTGPTNRYGGVLFVEKEGFKALFDQVEIAERYDIAMMSTKGLSVTASREAVETLCADYNIPLFVLTDLDKAGFSGAGTFLKSNRRHTYIREFDVHHIGLRLEDVRRLGIENLAEDSFDRGTPEAVRNNLKANGATKAEIKFLTTPLEDSKAEGKRVELNALTSSQLVALVERKLRQHGLKKVMPKPTDLAKAYRLFKRGEAINEIVVGKIAEFKNLPVPADLEKRVKALLKDKPQMPWDDAVAQIAGYGATRSA